MEIDYLLQDTYTAIRPQWVLITDLDEAAQAFAEAVQSKYKNQNGERAGEEADDGESSESEDNLEDDAAELDVNDSSADEVDENGEDASDDEDRAQESSDEEHIVILGEKKQIDPEAEAEFDREFAAMMTESLDARKNERSNRFDVPLPVRRAQRGIPEAYEEPDTPKEVQPNKTQTTMPFQLMTKKGNRQQVTMKTVRFIRLIFADSNDRFTFRLTLCCINEISTSS